MGPPLHLVATWPADGAGLDCDASDPDCGVPLDSPIELRFDRYLLPATAVRQSLLVSTGQASCRLARPPAPAVCFEPEYDVLERVVSFRLVPGAELLPGVLYTVELVVPGDEQPYGFRAFDGASLLEASAPLRFSFRTATVRAPPVAPEPIPTCADVVDGIFGAPSGAACATCHAGDAPPLGLRLDSKSGLIETALGRVARETDLAPHAGRALDAPPRFGLAMPIIAPGRPDTSYLLYKLLVNDDNYGAGPERCATAHRVPLPPGECLPPSARERERLREWFVLGQPMPLAAPPAAPARHLELHELRAIQRYIAGGARTDGCR